MKGIAVVPFVMLALLPSAPVSLGTNPEQDKAVVRYVFDRAWNDAAFDSLPDFWAPATPFHFRGRASPVGPEGVRAQVTNWRRAFPDLRFTMHDIISENGLVAVRLTFTGTHRATFMGVDSSGRAISVTEMMFFRVKDGRIVEAWEDYDEYGLRRQLAGQ